MAIIETRKLGLAAYIKMEQGNFLGVVDNKFRFESEMTAEEWDIRYCNTCCHRHDMEVMALRGHIKR